jgi:hypothetical protein
MLQNPASFRFDDILRSESSLPQTMPHGAIIRTTSDRRSNECVVVCGSNKLERTTLKVDLAWPATEKKFKKKPMIRFLNYFYRKLNHVLSHLHNLSRSKCSTTTRLHWW